MARPRYAVALAEIRRRAQIPTRRCRSCDPTFHEMGRLYYATVQSLDGDAERTVYGELRALAGDRPRKQVDSAISNASYASRVYAALVIPGHLTEEEFDALTFADCLAAVSESAAQARRPPQTPPSLPPLSYASARSPFRPRRGARARCPRHPWPPGRHPPLPYPDASSSSLRKDGTRVINRRKPTERTTSQWPRKPMLRKCPPLPSL